jgi:hypothetical protein
MKASSTFTYLLHLVTCLTYLSFVLSIDPNVGFEASIDITGSYNRVKSLTVSASREEPSRVMIIGTMKV